MWDRKELKAKGKAAFRRNYWSSVVAAFIAMAIVGGGAVAASSTTSNASAEQTAEVRQMLEGVPVEGILLILLALIGIGAMITLVVTIISGLLFNPLKVGCSRFFLTNADSPAKLGELAYGYKSNYGNMVKTLLIRDAFLWLWGLLFVIPGLIKAYSYRMVPYILAENPNMGSLEAITLSRQMMDGHKWNTFILDLSFLGWDILTFFTLGLAGLLYAGPYQFATGAELYKSIRDISSVAV